LILGKITVIVKFEYYLINNNVHLLLVQKNGHRNDQKNRCVNKLDKDRQAIIVKSNCEIINCINKYFKVYLSNSEFAVLYVDINIFFMF